MERIKKWVSKGLFAFLAMMMVVISLAGCNSADAEKALDIAVEVLEVVESLDAETAEYVDDETEQESILQSIPQSTSQSTSQASETDSEDSEDVLTIEEDGHYTSKEEVALYLHIYGKLPSNFISKNEAEKLGWKQKQGEAGQLHVVAPGMSIGGSKFGNYEGLLPEKKGRQYYECDINYVKGNRGAERIVYSNDGLIFYTGDHYESFEQLYPVE